jgi:hypothetical protein
MSSDDWQIVVALLAVVAMVMLAALAAQYHWFRDGSMLQRSVFFLTGVASIAVLRVVGVPPAWFDGSKPAFTLAATLIVGAFIGRAGREFRLPLFTGMGGALLVLNVLPHL